MHRLPRPLLAVLTVLAVALGACGGDDVAAQPAPDVLAGSFGKAPRSGKLDLRVAFDGKDLTAVQGPFKLALQGPFAAGRDGRLPRFALGAHLEAGGRALSGGAISTGSAGWLTFAGRAFALDRSTFAGLRAAYGRDRERGGGQSLEALGIDPADWLAAPRKVGEETIGGTRTVHVTATVDVPAVLEDISRVLSRADAAGAVGAAGAAGAPGALTAEQRAGVRRSVARTSVDVYAGAEDGILRRLNLQVRFAVPAELRADAGGLSTGTLGLDLVLTDVDEAQEIEPPARSRPLADLRKALR